MLFILAVLCSCSKQKGEPSVIATMEVKKTTQATLVDLSKMTTVGNHSYAPLNINGGVPSDYVDEVLNILADFEKKYPEREITHWHIEKQQSAHTTGSYFFGIWIDHKLKKE